MQGNNNDIHAKSMKNNTDYMKLEKNFQYFFFRMYVWTMEFSNKNISEKKNI